MAGTDVQFISSVKLAKGVTLQTLCLQKHCCYLPLPPQISPFTERVLGHQGYLGIKLVPVISSAIHFVFHIPYIITELPYSSNKAFTFKLLDFLVPVILSFESHAFPMTYAAKGTQILPALCSPP